MGTVTGADTNKQPINRISVSTCQNHISSDIPHRILLNLEQEFPLIFYLYSKGLYMKGEILGRRNKCNWRKRGRGKGRRGRKKRKKAGRKEEGARLLLQQCARSNYFHCCLLLMWRKPVLNYPDVNQKWAHHLQLTSTASSIWETWLEFKLWWQCI